MDPLARTILHMKPRLFQSAKILEGQLRTGMMMSENKSCRAKLKILCSAHFPINLSPTPSQTNATNNFWCVEFTGCSSTDKLLDWTCAARSRDRVFVKGQRRDSSKFKTRHGCEFSEAWASTSTSYLCQCPFTTTCGLER